MATSTASSTSRTAAVSSDQGADDNYAFQSAPQGADPQGGDKLPADPRKHERRKNNHLEKEIPTLQQQLNRFSEINPEEYSRLQEAEHQKQVIEERMELRERQREEASAQRVAAVASEREGARQQVLRLRKDRLLERAISQAEEAAGRLLPPGD
jgi:hypothetical protein